MSYNVMQGIRPSQTQRSITVCPAERTQRRNALVYFLAHLTQEAQEKNT